MKIIFEYEDGTYRIVPNVTLKKLRGNAIENSLIARYISDEADFREEYLPFTGFGYGTKVVHQTAMYIIADGNRLAGFGPHKDKQNTWKNIQYLQKRLAVYRKLMDELNEVEDLSTHLEKAKTKPVEEQAMDELFEHVMMRK